MKKVLALLIAAAMVLSLAACSGTSGSDPSTESGSEDVATGATEATTAAEDTGNDAAGAWFKDGNLVFRAFLELTGEELVALVEGQGYEWYENEYVMSGFADQTQSSGFQKDFYGRYIQVYNSPTDYRGYEDIKAAAKGALAQMAVAFNVKGEYQDGQEAMSGIFDGLEIAGSWKDPYDERGSGAVRVKDGDGVEYLALYTTEFYAGAPAVVSVIVRTDAYFAANPFAGAESVDAVWSGNYS